jgi:thiamine pyrophosphokinase
VKGVAFIGGEGPSPEACRRLLAEVGCLGASTAPASANADSPAASAPVGNCLFAAADSGLIAAEAADIRVDWIVGDMDSLDDAGRLDKYSPDRIIRYPTDKDYTDTELSLRLLWDKGCDHITIIGGGGGRIDHIFAIRALFEREPCPDRWITASEDIHCLKSGGAVKFERGGGSAASSQGQPLVSVFPLGDGPWSARSEGLKWPLDGLSWDRGFFGISNVIDNNVAASGEFSIRALSGRFLIVFSSQLQNVKFCN